MVCRGGSWDGVEKPGHPYNLRKIVEFKRRPDGSQDMKAFEVYARREPDGPFYFLHEGTTTDADGPWTF